MSHNPPSRYTWTYSEYARFPNDGNRYEVIDGEVLVTPAPSPNHQHVLFKLGVVLSQYVERHSLGIVLLDVDLLFVTGQFVRPDLVFVPESARDGITDRGVEKPPGLIVEVLSPTSASIDRVLKPRRYGDFGVPEYWVLDAPEKCAWVWRFLEGLTEPERVTDAVTWQPHPDITPLEVSLEKVLHPL